MLHNLGLTRLRQSDPEQGTGLLEESLALYREVGRQEGVAINLHGLALAALERCDYDVADALSREGLRLARELGYKTYMAYCLEAMAAAAVGREDWDRAARLAGAAQGLREVIDAPLPPNERARFEPFLAALRATLGENAFAIAWAEGRAMSWEQAVAYALGQATPA